MNYRATLTRLFPLLFTAFLCTCDRAQSSSAEMTTAPTAEPDDGWITLFDGSGTAGWRGYNATTLPPGWTVQNGELTFDDGAKTSDAEYEGGKDIIYAAREFDNFELELEWKIPPGGNSGIFYHVKEGYGGIPEVAPEYQLIDDAGYTDHHDISGYNASLGYGPELQDWQSTAADYAMYPGRQDDKVLHPAGQWNSARIVFTPARAEYWLNGKLVTDFVPWSDDWTARRNSGKFTNAPDYGKFRSGYIGLQDHDSPLWFRNIRVRPL